MTNGNVMTKLATAACCWAHHRRAGRDSVAPIGDELHVAAAGDVRREDEREAHRLVVDLPLPSGPLMPVITSEAMWKCENMKKVEWCKWRNEKMRQCRRNPRIPQFHHATIFTLSQFHIT